MTDIKKKKPSALDKLHMVIATDINGVAYDITKKVFGEEVAKRHPGLTLDVYERFNFDDNDEEEEQLTEDLQLALATAKERFGDVTPDIALRYYDHIITGASSPLVAEIMEDVKEHLGVDADADDDDEDEDEDDDQ